MKKINIEVCCGNILDVVLAAKCKVDRIELNSALELGGLTPSYRTFIHAKKLGIPLMVMIQSRNAGFCYSEEEYITMLKDARWFIENGTNGLVFGFLDQNGNVDHKRVKEMMSIIGNKTSVFHIAIDNCINMEKSIKELIDLGVNRLLTAGGIGDIDDNQERLKMLENTYGDKIEILPGGRVTKRNVGSLIKNCNLKQVHLSMKKTFVDIPLKIHDLGYINGFSYNGVDELHLKKVVKIVRRIESQSE